MATELQSHAKSEVAVRHDAEEVDQDGYTRDDRDLIRLGKKPVLKRNFGFMSILGISCTVLVTWEGILIVSAQSLFNGGPAGLLWSYIIVWIGTISTFISLSELASMAPTAGGQYHWVAMLAPDSSRKFLSYLAGWLTLFGWQAITASAAYLVGTLLQSVIIMVDSNYAPQPWQAMLFFWSILAFSVFINTVASKTLSHFEGIILVLHVFGFLAVLIPLVYLAPHGNASVLKEFYNGGMWPNQGLSFLIGMPAAVYSLFGADAAVHMAEEIKHASTVLPQSIMISVLLNGALGFAMVIALLFCLGDFAAVLESQATIGYPFLYVFLKGTGSEAGAAVMGMIIVVLGACAVVGILASSSRMMWSFSRDRAVPLWQHLIKLDERTSIPIYAIALTTLISVLLSLITLGSAVAFNNIVNLSISAVYSSYLLCCALLLYRRMQADGIKPYDTRATRVGPGSLRWGPWRLPGALGTANNIFACVYLFFVFFWAFWPSMPDVVPETMNFSVLTFGGTVLFAVVWYFLRGRKEYVGPTVEIEL